MNLEKKLEKIVDRILPGDQYFLTGISAKQAGPKTKISIFLDGDQGIDIDVCARVSRQLGKELEELNMLDHPYTLMVSSPGLDQPLKLPRQYRSNLGKTVRIRLTNQEQKEGKLSEVSENYVVLDGSSEGQGGDQTQKILFADIETTHVLVTF